MRHIFKKRDNFNEVKDLRKKLTEMKKLTLEGFIMPDEDESHDDYEDYGDYDDDRVLRRDREEGSFESGEGISDIEKELIEIRKIALSVINRLADQTSSESYDTMKRIWSLVDKAIESKNDEEKNNRMNKK